MEGLYVSTKFPGDHKVYGVQKESTVELRMELTGNVTCFCFHGDYHFDRTAGGNCAEWSQAPKQLTELMSEEECVTLLLRAEHHLAMLGIMEDEMYAYSLGLTKEDGKTSTTGLGNSLPELQHDPCEPQVHESHTRFRIQMERHTGLHPRCNVSYQFVIEYKHPYTKEPMPRYKDPFNQGEEPRPTLVIILEPSTDYKNSPDRLAMKRINPEILVQTPQPDGVGQGPDVSPVSSSTSIGLKLDPGTTVNHPSRGVGTIESVGADGRRAVRFQDGVHRYKLECFGRKLHVVDGSAENSIQIDLGGESESGTDEALEEQDQAQPEIKKRSNSDASIEGTLPLAAQTTGGADAMPALGVSPHPESDAAPARGDIEARLAMAAKAVE